MREARREIWAEDATDQRSLTHAKAETEYKRTLCRFLALIRRECDLPYGWIVDSTRRHFKGQSVDAAAISQATLRETYSKCITRRVDAEALGRMREVNKAERETL